MDPFVTHLVQLCTAHPTRSKWVFVPAHGIGRTLGDRLVLEGTDWANIRFVTPLDIALRMGAPYLIERGIDPSEDQLGPALIMRLLLELPEDSGYFRPLAHEPQLARALWNTIRELRLAGMRASDLKPEAFESESKFTELHALVEAYEQHLVTNNLGDQATVYEEALAHLDWCPIKPADCWTTLPNVTWSPLQERLFASFPGERTTPDAPGVGRGFSRAEASAAFFAAGGPEAEVEEVIRRILASKRRLDEVEISCASEGYATLLWEKACRYEWPVTLEAGLPATLTRPGRALLGFIEWVEDGFAAGKLRRLLQSGDVTLETTSEVVFENGRSKTTSEVVSTLSPGRAARLLVRAEAAWGRDTYRLALERLAKSSRARATEDIGDDEREYLEKRAKEAEALAAWIDALIALVPEEGSDGLLDLQSLVAGAVKFVEDYTARASALDHAAAERLAASLKELSALGDFQCPLSQALRFLRERAESLHIGADRPRPGHLHISRLRTAAYANRPLLFIVGLEEGRVFPAATEDPVLLDRERDALRAKRPQRSFPASSVSETTSEVVLQTASQRLDTAVRQTMARLDTAMCMPGVSVHLSYSCRDLRQFRATYASWVMLHAFRSATGNPAATYQDLHKATGTPVSVMPATPDQAPSQGRWWLQGAARGGDRAAVLKHFGQIAQGVAAEAHRDSMDFTEFDGYVPEAGSSLDPAQADKVVSPTQLEQAAKCPFRHFLKRGLGVEAIESGDRDRDVWLNPLIRGSLLHDLYARLLQRCTDEQRKPTLPVDHDWLQTEGQKVLDRIGREMPASSGEVLERETREFLEDLTIFVKAEVESPAGSTPIAFEAGFGPIEITAGGVTLHVKGRIDRIDQLADGTFEILDYKTGGYFDPAWHGTFAGGRRLQHALYGLAAAELLRKRFKNPQVSQATYYFSSTKGRQHRKHIPAQSKADIGKVLGDLREVIASGLFVHTPDEGNCKFCDYGAACGPRVVERAKAKADAAELTPFRRLADYV